MDDRVATNRRRWDEMAALHERSYLGDDTQARDADLAPFEATELGDVTGQRVCHLQCHIGGDSLSLARLGASVTGVDFSAVAIDTARRRAEGAGLADRVTFVCATVEEAAEQGPGAYDGVYTSWGVLCWLPDLEGWARAIHQLLVPGGWLYLAETHPYAIAVRRPDDSYGGGVGHFNADQGDYTDDGAVFEHPESWEWTHGIGDVVSVLGGAGLPVEWLHEHPVVAWHLNDADHLRRRPDGMWEAPGSTLPLSFSLRATRSR